MLIKCPECSKEVSDKAEACPNCAYPLTEKIEDPEVKKEKQKPDDIKAEELEYRPAGIKLLSIQIIVTLIIFIANMIITHSRGSYNSALITSIFIFIATCPFIYIKVTKESFFATLITSSYWIAITAFVAVNLFDGTYN